MVELFIDVFADVGLELNAAKSKHLLDAADIRSYADIGDNLVESLEARSYLKYSGSYLPGDCVFRQIIEVNHQV